MQLTRVDVRNVRVLREVTLAPHERINVVVGANGAGKTSLLEAIHILGTGRSFRSRESEKVIRWGARELSVFAEAIEPGGAVRRMGVVKDATGGRARMDGEEMRGFASMAHVLPLGVYGAESLDLLGGPPERRRALINWALFHVEQGYGDTLQRYRRALRQRNASLAAGAGRAETRAWEGELVSEAERLDRWRESYAGIIEAHVNTALSALWDLAVELSYRRGWPREEPLAVALERSWTIDRARGWTAFGPHAADLSFRVNGRPARDGLSRGERKVLVAAVVLGHVAYIRASTGRAPIVLADDLPSELDERGRGWFLAELVRTGSQVFVTALEPHLCPFPDRVPSRMFHVEQGRLRELV